MGPHGAPDPRRAGGTRRLLPYRKCPFPVVALLPEVPDPSARSTTGSVRCTTGSGSAPCRQAARCRDYGSQHPLRPGRNYNSQQVPGGGV